MLYPFCYFSHILFCSIFVSYGIYYIFFFLQYDIVIFQFWLILLYSVFYLYFIKSSNIWVYFALRCVYELSLYIGSEEYS